METAGKLQMMRFCAVFMTVLSMALTSAVSAEVCTYVKTGSFSAANEIDTLLLKSLEKKNLTPADRCSDSVFIRRVYLDVLGTIPDATEVRKFLENPRSDKRTALITTLLETEGFADYWSLKWCDLLRVKAEFPINLWPNAVQAYHRWIYDAIAGNIPYNQFARQLLTASGSNFRIPQVNFYRAIQGQNPSTIASAVALTWMGSRIENWPADRRDGMAAFFSGVAYKETAEWKEEIVYLNPAPVETIKTIFPDGQKVQILPDQDPREVLADWLITDDNSWFARTIVNRIWYWLMGRGIIHEPDDIRPDNPPVHPELLAYLEKELVRSGYDLKHIYKLILNSWAYQQASIPKTDPEKSENLFACYPVRQLDAEVLIDVLCRITDTTESYSSPIPEPFTFIPEENRSIELADGSITSQFLELFGRPTRDTGLLSERSTEPSAAQRRALLNSSHIQNKIERSWRLNNLLRRTGGNRTLLIQTIYLNILSRYPTETEQAIVNDYFKTSKLKINQASVDLTWALINSKEFLYRH
jgi:hypothetical protein